MAPTSPTPTEPSDASLLALGRQIRARRKALRVNATAAAEAAGMSRVTLHRIEKGEPSVAAGAWSKALAALGMTLLARSNDDVGGAAPLDGSSDPTMWIPVRVRLAEFPQLKALAWQVHGTDTLTPVEALTIYERNARHLDSATLLPKERALLQALRTGLGGAGPAPGDAADV
jgi:transcriptional regulator with XRE-family HTH domain